MARSRLYTASLEPRQAVNRHVAAAIYAMTALPTHSINRIARPFPELPVRVPYYSYCRSRLLPASLATLAASASRPRMSRNQQGESQRLRRDFDLRRQSAQHLAVRLHINRLAGAVARGALH